MKQKQEYFQEELKMLTTLIPQELREAIGFEQRSALITYDRQNKQKATQHINQLYTALFTVILQNLGKAEDDFSLSGFLSSFFSDDEVFTEILGDLGSKELFLSRLQMIYQACKANEIPADTDMIRVTKKILSDFNYLKTTADNAKTAEHRRQLQNLKLIEFTKTHNKLVEIFNLPINPFEPFEAQGYKNLARQDTFLKGLMAKRQELIEASRPSLDKSQNPDELARQNQQLTLANKALQENSEEIAQRAAALNSLIEIYEAATVLNELESTSVFNPLESKLQKTDKQLLKLKATRQTLVEKSMSLREIAQDSDELNEKIKQLLDIKSKLLINSSEIEKREEVLHNRLLKKSQPRVAAFMTEQEVADERAAKEAANERAALETAEQKASEEKNRQEYKETFETILNLRVANKDIHAQIKLIEDRQYVLISKMTSCYAITQDSTVKSLRDKYSQLINQTKKQKLAENDPATLQSIDDLHNEKTNIIAANVAIQSLLNELIDNEPKLEKAIASAKKAVEGTKTAITNKIKSIEDYIAPIRNKEPYQSMPVLRKNENGISYAEQIILKQKNIAVGLDLYSSMSMNDRAQHAHEILDSLTDTLKVGFLHVRTQYLTEIAKLREELGKLKSIKVCPRYVKACVDHFKELESEMATLEDSCKQVDQFVDEKRKDQLVEKMKHTAITLESIATEMDRRENSKEIKIVQKLLTEINRTLDERRKELGIDDKAPTDDLIVVTLTDFRTHLHKLATDYLDLNDFPKPPELARADFITTFLHKMQTTFTEDKIQDLRDSNIFIDFINLIADLFSAIETLIPSNSKKPAYRAQFWPSPTEGQITQAASIAHDALSDLQTQLGVVAASVLRKNAE